MFAADKLNYMYKATTNDKDFIINILAESFDDNKSVNYIIRGGEKKKAQIRALMNYSFEICNKFGEVLLNEERTACALLLFPDKKKTNLQTILLDIKLMLHCIGLINIKKVLKREKKIKSLYPEKEIIYLWYIAVNKSEQGKGIGTQFLKKIVDYAASVNKDIYLETSAAQNVNWYKKMGFELYEQIDFGYILSCFRKSIK